MASLVDTNVLVYRFDAEAPAKQRAATNLLRAGISSWNLRIPHQALIEFVSVTTRPNRRGKMLLTGAEARDETEKLLNEFEVLYPDEGVLRQALWGMAAYQLSWYDAHLWAYAQHYQLDEILSEDFQPNRLYGTVRITNPFL